MTLIERDRRAIWHPYTQHGRNPEILPVVSGQGAWLELADGRKCLDAISSWWVNIHGHGRPEIAQAIAEQAQRLEHVLFAGFTHEPAVRLAELLLSASGADRCFFSDNGSTAVEVALKMAFQFHVNRGTRERTRFLALRGAYHGDTLGAMAAGEPGGFHTLFRPLLPEVDFVEPGNEGELERVLSSRHHAAMIVEPIIQGAGGMRVYPASYLRRAAELCRQRGVLFICDEVFTGFYRTGKLFAFEHAGIHPDLICVSKGITGGFLPLAATLVSESIFAAFSTPDLRTAFLHGHSYTANPIACAAALASWQLLQSPSCQQRIQTISQATRAAFDGLRSWPGVRAAWSLGTIGALELSGRDGYFSDLGPRILASALKRGVLLRPLGNVIYTLPPYCVTDEELARIFTVIAEVISEISEKLPEKLS